MTQRRDTPKRMFRLALDRDQLSLFMASLVATIVMALSFYLGRVDLLTVAKRVAVTVFVVYPATFFLVWRVVSVAASEGAGRQAQRADRSEDTETNAGEGV